MKIIGLTGGSGTGKGTVAARMRALGAGWVDADAVYRTLCAENREMLSALDAAFGGVTDQNGALDRPKLAKIVFSDPQSCSSSTKSPHRISARRLSMRFTRRARVQSCCTMRRPCLKPVRMTSATKSSLCSRRTTRALPESSSGTVCPTRPRAPASTRSRTTCFTAKNAILSSKTTAISILCIGTPMLYTVNSLSDSD